MLKAFFMAKTRMFHLAITAGEEDLQQAVMASAVPGTLTAHMMSQSEGVREAATWCVINLAFNEAQPRSLQVHLSLCGLLVCMPRAHLPQVTAFRPLLRHALRPESLQDVKAKPLSLHCSGSRS